MEMHRAKFRGEWFQCRLRSSSSGKNKLKKSLVDSDNSTVEVPFSSKRKAANAFGYCLESEGCLIQNKQYDFNNDELEVVDILFNLLGNFLERVNLETSNSVLNSSPSVDQK
ncbi:hypothetical protein Ahy_A07g031590 [Arachis hypogaea]|uniref:Uncharacterized protein n=1 Tax=Arachis hypogaea TaxID=3818 RepID=A0A445C4D1_ARAHY|nr:hypothetical protein Ahy_A07g031590 [Arachis hypogaea]